MKITLPHPSHHLRSGTVAILLLFTSTAQAQFSIPSFTIDGGGGRSTGGPYVLSGTSGQPDASAPLTGGSFSLRGGFWRPENSITGGYATWAAANIPAGNDAAFGGDWNRDGISNGIDYAFGTSAYAPTGNGQFAAPSAPPADVVLRFEFSTDLLSWETRAEWDQGAAPDLEPGVTNTQGTLTDSSGNLTRTGYWRFEAQLVTP